MSANTTKKITELTLVSNTALVSNNALVVLVLDPSGSNVETVAVTVNTFLQIISTRLGL